jgi:hypothetical protein
MSTARKILDLHGQDTEALARELATLPHGRYVLVPENEIEESDLAPEEIAAINEGIDAADRGELHNWEDVRAEMDAMIAAARPGRSRSAARATRSASYTYLLTPPPHSPLGSPSAARTQGRSF